MMRSALRILVALALVTTVVAGAGGFAAPVAAQDSDDDEQDSDQNQDVDAVQVSVNAGNPAISTANSVGGDALAGSETNSLAANAIEQSQDSDQNA